MSGTSTPRDSEAHQRPELRSEDLYDLRESAYLLLLTAAKVHEVVREGATGFTKGELESRLRRFYAALCESCLPQRDPRGLRRNAAAEAVVAFAGSPNDSSIIRAFRYAERVKEAIWGTRSNGQGIVLQSSGFLSEKVLSRAVERVRTGDFQELRDDSLPAIAEKRDAMDTEVAKSNTGLARHPRNCIWPSVATEGSSQGTTEQPQIADIREQKGGEPNGSDRTGKGGRKPKWDELWKTHELEKDKDPNVSDEYVVKRYHQRYPNRPKADTRDLQRLRYERTKRHRNQRPTS